MANLDREKALAARHSMSFVQTGMVVGLGTGSTARHALAMLGELIRGGLRIRGVATSTQTTTLAREHGIPLVTLDDVPGVDLTIDGADEVVQTCDAIKGAGGALVREKIVAVASARVVLIVDSTKVVSHLGAGPVPVEVVPFGQSPVRLHLQALGFAPTLRRNDAGDIYRTENGNVIFDCRLAGGAALPEDDALQAIPGVVGHGVFRGIAHHVIVARGDQIVQWDRR